MSVHRIYKSAGFRYLTYRVIAEDVVAKQIFGDDLEFATELLKSTDSSYPCGFIAGSAVFRNIFTEQTIAFFYNDPAAIAGGVFQSLAVKHHDGAAHIFYQSFALQISGRGRNARAAHAEHIVDQNRVS